MTDYPTVMLTPVQIAEHDEVWGREEDGHFPIYTRNEPVDGGQFDMKVSQWKPTPQQLEDLNKGASIFLGIQCHKHPPIVLGVSSAPAVEKTEPFDG